MATPYELRFQILEMAQGFLSDNYSRAECSMHQAWDLARDDGTANMKLWKEIQPETYTVDDIKEKASEFYEFVQRK